MNIFYLIKFVAMVVLGEDSCGENSHFLHIPFHLEYNLLQFYFLLSFSTYHYTSSFVLECAYVVKSGTPKALTPPHSLTSTMIPQIFLMVEISGES